MLSAVTFLMNKINKKLMRILKIRVTIQYQGATQIGTVSLCLAIYSSRLNVRVA